MNNKITQETLENTLKPFDIVRTKSGEIAFITEVNLNTCQSSPVHQVSYSVKFITENIPRDRSAWYENDELELLGNIFIKIAESTASHQQSYNVPKLFNNIKTERGKSW